MLVTCPRCGFQQPKDQYCASCGIDMLAFKPQNKNSAAKIFRSGAFQVFALLAVVGTTAYVIGQTDSSQKWVQRLTYPTKTVVKNAPSPNTSANMARASSAAPTTKEVQVSAADAEAAALVPEQNLAATASSPNAENSARALMGRSTPGVGQTTLASAPQNPQPVQATKTSADATLATTSVTAPATQTLNVTLASVPRDQLMQWMSESQRLNLFQNLSELSAGILPIDFFKENNRYTLLTATEVKKTEADRSSFFYGSTNPTDPAFLGLSFDVEARAAEGNLLRGRLIVTKSTRAGKETLPIDFELQRGSVFFINWRRQLHGLENETSLFSKVPFKILTTSEYRSQRNDFIILLEPK